MTNGAQMETYLPTILGQWDGTPSKLRLKGFEDLKIALMGHLFAKKLGTVVLVFQHAKDARIVKEWLDTAVLGTPFRSHHWAHLDYWGEQRYSDVRSLTEERISTIAALSVGESVVITTTADALIRPTTYKEWFQETLIRLTVDLEVDREDLASRFIGLGYTKVSRVEEPGTFFIRGSILDVYPSGSTDAFRVEYFADVIVSIKKLSLETQRSLEGVNSIVIPPFSEFLSPVHAYPEAFQKFYDVILQSNLNLEDRNRLLSSVESKANSPIVSKYFDVSDVKKSTLSDYVKDPMWILEVEPSTLVSLAVERANSGHESIARTFGSGFCDAQAGYLKRTSEKIYNLLESHSTLVLGGVSSSRKELYLPSAKGMVSLGTQKNARDFLHLIKTQLGMGWFIFCETPSRLERVEKVLLEANIPIENRLQSTFQVFQNLSQSGVHLVLGKWLSTISFEMPDQVIFLPSDVIVHERAELKKRHKAKDALDVRSLRHGDYVAHEDHGIGKFLGSVVMSVGGMTLDCLALEYADGDKIYVPVTGLNKLEKYSEADSDVNLDKLSGLGWFKRREKARAAAKIAAEDLLKIQALRKGSKHIPFKEPGDLYHNFCADFPYQETEDQLQALEDIENDLQSDFLMDRLVIGDVGFGKTELAIRAAYRTVLEGKQVLMICPTTILSQQHFNTFKSRMQAYGVKVAHLNRFVKPSDREKYLTLFALGQYDVLIGTHILLGKSVEPYKLGLLVVDEEQKFGVGHKENIKKLRSSCDVLTLSATPIPRTLHMATSGLKEVSILSSPPKNRIAVRNVLSKWDSELIADAIQSEIHRGGQVFFVHNRIEDIGVIESKIRSYIPDVSIRIAHGKLDAGDLERIMLDFLDQKFTVLLSTSIIESGVDISNVNTIIINNAHQFGLSQLYQLRGRVGRSSTQGFAYLIIPDESSLSKEAKSRLEAIMGHQELGSGFYVASRDLEIRGAGNVLGAEQSGFVESVGIELYSRLLAAELKKLKGESVAEEIEPEIKLGITAYIPEESVPDEPERIKYYRLIFRAASIELLEDIMEEVVDRFGKLNEEFSNLFEIAKIRVLMKKIRGLVISFNVAGAVEVKFGPLESGMLNHVINLSHAMPHLFRILPDFRLVLCNVKLAVDMIDRLKILAGDY